VSLVTPRVPFKICVTRLVGTSIFRASSAALTSSLTGFGDGGRQPGEFYGVHSMASDSKGNVFTTETYHGQRVQKFIYKGIALVTKKNQGVLWPKLLTKIENAARDLETPVNNLRASVASTH
jgi:hypothetical protein